MDLSDLGRLWTGVILIVTFLVAIDRLTDKLIREILESLFLINSVKYQKH